MFLNKIVKIKVLRIAVGITMLVLFLASLVGEVSADDGNPNFISGIITIDSAPAPAGTNYTVTVTSGTDAGYSYYGNVDDAIVPPIRLGIGAYSTGDDAHFNSGDSFILMVPGFMQNVTGTFVTGGNGNLITYKDLVNLSLYSITGPVHNINTGINYSTIQSAINDANPGDEIHVDSGIYNENVNVNRQLILRGVNTGSGLPVVKAAGSQSTIMISANNVSLEGFIAVNSNKAGIEVISSNNVIKYNHAIKNKIGILLSSSNNNLISGNNASYNFDSPLWLNSNAYGIYLSSSANNTLDNNIASSNEGTGIDNMKGTGYGIYLSSSNHNLLINNNASSNYGSGYTELTGYGYGYGIYMNFSDNNVLNNNTASLNLGEGWGELISIGKGYGIYLSNSNNNILGDNTAKSNKGNGYAVVEGVGINLDFSGNNELNRNTVQNNLNDGIHLKDSSNNILTGNNAGLNMRNGFRLISSINNLIYHNNLINNKKQASDNNINYNNWSHPVLLEGNYWSDYKGIDDGSGTGKHDFSGDHIGDTLIPHPSEGYDFYPYVYENGWMRPAIVVYTDKTDYSSGDTMKIGLNITNPGIAASVAIGIWLDLPDGEKNLIFSDPSVPLPAGLDIRKYPLLTLALPNIPAGNYTWHALIKNPITGEIMCESISPWTFGSPENAGNQVEIGTILQGEEIDIKRQIELN